MPLVAIIWHGRVHFKTYNYKAAIQSSCHDSIRFDASIASHLALMIGFGSRDPIGESSSPFQFILVDFETIKYSRR